MADAYHDEARDPVPRDLEAVAGGLRALGVRCRLGEGGLWAGKLCLRECGTVSIDGRVRGLDPTCFGRGVAGFVAALRQVRLIPEQPQQPASGTRDRARRCSWRRLPRATPRRLKGRRAERAIERMRAFLDEHDLSYEQLGPGRFLICGRVSYNPASGRVRRKGGRTHAVKGLAALANVLAAEASDPKWHHLYPPLLRQGDPGVPIAATEDEPLERVWAGTLAARAGAIAAGLRPARGAVAQCR